MNLLVVSGNVSSDLDLLLCYLALFENIVRLSFLNQTSTHLLVFQWKGGSRVGNEGGQKDEETICFEESAGWKAHNISRR